MTAVAWVMVEAASNRRSVTTIGLADGEVRLSSSLQGILGRALSGEVTVRLNVDLVTNAVQRRQAEMLELLEHDVNLDSPSEDKALADVVGDVFPDPSRGARTHL